MPQLIFVNLPVTDVARSRTFQDPDGNVFEPMWMDPAAVQG